MFDGCIKRTVRKLTEPLQNLKTFVILNDHNVSLQFTVSATLRYLYFSVSHRVLSSVEMLLYIGDYVSWCRILNVVICKPFFIFIFFLDSVFNDFEKSCTICMRLRHYELSGCANKANRNTFKSTEVSGRNISVQRPETKSWDVKERRNSVNVRQVKWTF